ncbi:K(+)-transporting ATPase subunit F [Paenibacillus phocaensis]|uniref:K(+)-transporting ATPase subunit F n=1 Tax=Paenibacillus phocaensis TaxID=1776378 RepID=UPI00039F5DCF|nr:K(+)-transporting ATPase subunit F [Paenibacillus phocaensis]
MYDDGSSDDRLDRRNDLDDGGAGVLGYQSDFGGWRSAMMWGLGILIIAVFVYLAYALLNPEKF